MTTSSLQKHSTIRGFFLNIFDLIAFAVLALGILLFVRFFVINIFNVVGASMSPTFMEKDFILVDKISTQLKRYDRGDVIIFIPPGQDRAYIKRIIGLPGETIKIDSGSVFLCDGASSCKELDETYLPENTFTTQMCGKSEFVINEGFFVLGDNRGASTDSRCCFNGIGCYENSSYEVPSKNIIGKVFLRMFPNFQIFKS